eukprot:661761-Hanusia_phi.AAC.1
MASWHQVALHQESLCRCFLLSCCCYPLHVRELRSANELEHPPCELEHPDNPMELRTSTARSVESAHLCFSILHFNPPYPSSCAHSNDLRPRIIACIGRRQQVPTSAIRCSSIHLPGRPQSLLPGVQLLLFNTERHHHKARMVHPPGPRTAPSRSHPPRCCI